MTQFRSFHRVYPIKMCPWFCCAFCAYISNLWIHVMNLTTFCCNKQNIVVGLAARKKTWRTWIPFTGNKLHQTTTKRKLTQMARFMGPTWGHLGPTGPRWAPWWPHELCYLGSGYLVGCTLDQVGAPDRAPGIISDLSTSSLYTCEIRAWTSNYII